MHYEASLSFDIFFAVYELLEPFWLKQFLRVPVMHSLNNRTLSALENISDPSPEYLVCKIQSKHTVPYLYRQGPERFPCPRRALCCLHPRPHWCVMGYMQARKPRGKGSLSFLWELLSPWGSWPYIAAASQMCVCWLPCLPGTKPDAQTDSLPSPPIWLTSMDLLGALWLWLTLVTICRLDPHLQLMVPVPDSPWERAQPCLLAVHLSSWPACPRRAACPRCSLTHGLPTDRVSSSGELLRTLA